MLKPTSIRFVAALALCLPWAAHAEEPDAFEKSLAQEYGLTIRHVDAAGKPPSTEESAAVGRQVIAYKGKDIVEKNDMMVNFEAPLYQLGAERVVLVALSSGGNACGATYMLISLKDGAANSSDEFGNCNDPQVQATPDSLQFTFNDGYAKRLIVTYKNGRITEENTTLPPHVDPKNTGRDFSYLATYTDRDDVEKILSDSSVAPLMSRVMAADWELLKDRLDVMEAPEIQDGFIVLQGGLPHSFTAEEGFLAISLTGTDVYAAILTTAESDKSIRAYTNAERTRNGPNPPPAMQAWFASHAEASPKWTFRR
jgi:hypothetical protein